MNSEKILENIFCFNLEIQTGFFKKITFVDPKLELRYQVEEGNLRRKNKIVSIVVILLGYFAFYFYIFFAFYRPIFLLTCTLCLILSTIFILLSCLTKINFFSLFNNFVQTFIFWVNFFTKAFLVCIYYNNEYYDNSHELLRIIIYEFITSNILLLINVESNLFISFFFFILNFMIIFIVNFYSKKNYNYFLEALTSFLLFLIFFLLRRLWDTKLRMHFSDKIKFIYFYKYTQDFINGMNGYAIYMRNNKEIYYNKKFLNLLTITSSIKIDDINTKMGNVNYVTTSEKCLTASNSLPSKDQINNVSNENKNLFELLFENTPTNDMRKKDCKNSNIENDDKSANKKIYEFFSNLYFYESQESLGNYIIF